MNTMTPETLRDLAGSGTRLFDWDLMRAAADAWEAQVNSERDDYARLHEDHLVALDNNAILLKWLEAAETEIATWRTLAGPIWMGDESEGHFVCLVCNQAGADDGGTKTIKHLPGCEYAAALAASDTRSSDEKATPSTAHGS